MTSDAIRNLPAGNALIQPWPVAGSIGAETRGMVDEASGIYLTDERGRRLIDGPAGMWCVNLGHRNAELARAMHDQAMTLSYNTPWYTSNALAERLAARIAAAAPGDLDHVFFTTGGSSAVETALRFMQFYNNVLGRPDKKMILSRGGAYHGSTYLTASLNGRPRDRDWMDGVDDLVVKLRCPNPMDQAEGQSPAAFCDDLVRECAETIARIGANRIGAMVAEPVMASGGVIIPPGGYLPRIRQLCRDNDILYISDEVVTAFGRLGHVFASQAVFGIEPDMITFAKGVTSGYFPLGGVAISARLMDDLRASGQPDAMFAHGLTYSSHPIGCAVAMKTLDLLEDGIMAHVQAITPHFQQRLADLAALPLVADTRSIGLIGCVECVATRQREESLGVDVAVGQRIDRHCQSLGLLVRPLINMCVMSPPLTIPRAQIDVMFDILQQGIVRTTEDLLDEGLLNI